MYEARGGHESAVFGGAAIERWNTARLMELVPGSTRATWGKWLPVLVGAGVLTKVGRGWLGSRPALLSALVTRLAETSSDASAAPEQV